MKKSVIIITAALFILVSCTKEEPVRTSGTDKIDNIRYRSTTFYIFGFTFSSGQLVSTETTPGPDITVDTVSSPPYRAIFQTSSLRPSFNRAGDFPDAGTAKAAFDNLKTVTATTWQDLADPVLPNQIWIFRSGSEKYTKIRIVSIERSTNDGVPVVEVTFEWVHQPDGSLTFP